MLVRASKNVCLLCALVFISLIAGCGTSTNPNGGTTPTSPVAIALAISPSTATVAIGATQQFTATATLSDGTTANVTSTATWTSSQTNIATISSAGLLTAVAQGTTTITATDGSVTSQPITVTVTAGGTTTPTISSIAVSPMSFAVVVKGTPLQFTATATMSDGTTTDVTSTATWASTATNIATINASGQLTFVAAGATQVTATTGGVTSTPVSVLAVPAPITSIAVSLPSASVAVGATQQFTATATLADGTTQDITTSVTWTSTATNIATISSGGLLSGIAPGTSNITATFGANTATVTVAIVSGGGSTNPSNGSLAITSATGSVTVGATLQFTAILTQPDGSTQDVTSSATWVSSTPAVAGINSSGLLSGVSAGTTTVTATYGSGSSAVTSPSATVTVLPGSSFTSFTITPLPPTIPLGLTRQLVALALINGSSSNITSQVQWSVSPSNVATVSPAGQFKATGLGAFTITGTVNGITETLTGTVSAAAPKTLQIQPSSASLPLGTTQQLSAVVTLTDGTTQTVTASVTWTSSNASIATVSASGLVTTVGQGTAQITGTYQAGSSPPVTGTFLASVSAASITSIAVTPPTASAAVGGSKQFTATAALTNGSTQVLTSATWASSNQSVATVSATGLVTAVSQGTSTITATAGGQTGSASFTVGPTGTLTGITILPANPMVNSGGTLQLMATGKFSDGSSQDETAALTYACTNPLVATIDTSGILHGIVPGTTTCTASQGAVSVSFTVTINPATLQSITIAPSSISLPAGVPQQLTAMANFSDGSSQDQTSSVIWSSNAPTIANVDSTGKLTALAVGNATITATATGGSPSATVAVTVTAATVTAVVISPPAIVLSVGQTAQYTATAVFSDGSSQDVTQSAQWSSPTASFATISNTGLLAAVTAGTGTVTVTFNGTVSSPATYTISPATLSSLLIQPSTLTLPIGTSQQLQVLGFYSDSTSQNLTASVNYSSSDSSVATVTSSGLVQMLSSTDSATITASIGSVQTNMTVNGSAATVISLAITPNNSSAAIGVPLQLTATATYNDGSTQDVTSQTMWTSSSTGAASVSTTGLITPIGAGTVTITAANGGQSATATFTTATITSITVTANGQSSANVPAGIPVQLAATANYSDGSTADITNSAIWSSSNNTIGTVTQVGPDGKGAGAITTLTTGSIQITATLGGVTGTIPVTVTNAALQSLTITPDHVSLLGQILGLIPIINLTTTGHFTDGTSAVISSGVSYAFSNNPLGATLNQVLGLLNITSAAGGSITVTATYQGVTGTQVITVGLL